MSGINAKFINITKSAFETIGQKKMDLKKDYLELESKLKDLTESKVDMFKP